MRLPERDWRAIERAAGLPGADLQFRGGPDQPDLLDPWTVSNAVEVVLHPHERGDLAPRKKPRGRPPETGFEVFLWTLRRAGLRARERAGVESTPSARAREGGPAHGHGSWFERLVLTLLDVLRHNGAPVRVRPAATVRTAIRQSSGSRTLRAAERKLLRRLERKAHPSPEERRALERLRRELDE